MLLVRCASQTAEMIFQTRSGMPGCGIAECIGHRKDTGMYMISMLELLLHHIVEAAILVFEFIGVGIIIFSGLQGFLLYIKRSPATKLTLAKGLAMGLEFKLGSEILRTVVVREWMEIGTVAGIIVLRAALTFLIHWEIKEEEKGIE
jgi:uncharacterized membrane protein